MSKVEKKREELQEKIDFLENELKMAIIKNDSSTKQIDIAEQKSKIIELKIELLNIV